MNRTSLVCIAIILMMPLMHAQDHNAADPWRAFALFPGAWSGHETGRAGTGSGERTYQRIIGDRYMIGRNVSRFLPQEKNPEGETHYDWAIFSYDEVRKVIVLREFHSEGFVIRYAMDSTRSTVSRFVFISESIENAPIGTRARLTLDLQSDDKFLEIFELAFPGKEFEEFLRNTWTRVNR